MAGESLRLPPATYVDEIFDITLQYNVHNSLMAFIMMQAAAPLWKIGYREPALQRSIKNMWKVRRPTIAREGYAAPEKEEKLVMASGPLVRKRDALSVMALWAVQNDIVMPLPHPDDSTRTITAADGEAVLEACLYSIKIAYGDLLLMRPDSTLPDMIDLT